MSSTQYKRKRNKSVTIRMSEAEYAQFRDKAHKSGFSQQGFILSAINGPVVTPTETIDVLKDINLAMKRLTYEIRGIASKVNNMIWMADVQGDLPAKDTLNEILLQIISYRKESDALWQLIRLLINQQNHMAQ